MKRRRLFNACINSFVFTTLFAGFVCIGPSQSCMAGSLNVQAKTEIAQIELFPEIVARVNDAEIEKKELLERVKAVQAQIDAPSGPTPLSVYQTILDELVNLELLYQESRTRNIEATSDEVENEYQSLKSRFPTEEAFQQQLASGGMTPDQLKQVFKKDLSVQKLVETGYESQVIVSDEEKRSFYAENSDRMQEPLRLRIRHLLVSVDKDALQQDRDEARQKIAGYRRQILDGDAEFEALARKFSDDPVSKPEGGELTITKGQTVPAFDAAAFSLLAGAVSDIVETQFGYHIIELIERLPERQVPYEEIESMIEKYLKQGELQQVIETEIKALRNKADIEIFI